jgi:hypothetical protein
MQNGLRIVKVCTLPGKCSSQLNYEWNGPISILRTQQLTSGREITRPVTFGDDKVSLRPFTERDEWGTKETTCNSHNEEKIRERLITQERRNEDVTGDIIGYPSIT